MGWWDPAGEKCAGVSELKNGFNGMGEQKRGLGEPKWKQKLIETTRGQKKKERGREREGEEESFKSHQGFSKLDSAACWPKALDMVHEQKLAAP